MSTERAKVPALLEGPGPGALFRPSEAQAAAKHTLHEYLARGHGVWTLTTIPLDAMVQVTGERKLREWFKDAEFAAWFGNAKAPEDLMAAAKHQIYHAILDMVSNDELPARDRLKAVDLWAKLTGSFAQPQVRFADRDLDSMSADEVERQVQDLRRKLDGVDSGGKA